MTGKTGKTSACKIEKVAECRENPWNPAKSP